MSTTEKKTKGMCIATRCTDVDQFVQMFHRYVDEESFFVSTVNTRPSGLETSFSVQLADGTPVLRGICVVLNSWTNAQNPFKTPGVRLGIKRLTANSMVVFERLLLTRSSTPPPLTNLPPPAPLTPELAQAISASTQAGGLPPPKLPASGVPTKLTKTPFNDSAPTRIASPRPDIKRDVSAVREATPTPTPLRHETTDSNEERTSIREPSAAVSTPQRPPLSVPLRPASKPAAPPAGTRAIAATPPSGTPVPTDTNVAAMADLPTPVPDATRTPGSEIVLPANPLMNLTDESLEGYVDCTLYEETGNFFPVEDDGLDLVDLAQPPSSRQRTTAPVAIARTTTPIGMRTTAPPNYDRQDTEESGVRFDSDTAPLPPRARPSIPPPAARSNLLIDLDAFSAPSGNTPPPSMPLEAPRFGTTTPPPLAVGTPAPPTFASGVIAPRLASWHSRKPARLWLVGGVGAVVLIAIVVFAASGSKGPAAAPAPPEHVEQVAITPAEAPRPAVVRPPPPEPTFQPEPEPPSSEEPPVVGAGPCKVVVNTTPAGSNVVLDGTRLGPSPVTVAATCNRHKLDISHPRYEATTKHVTLTEGKPGSVEVTLTRPTHSVVVTSSPLGATIFIDGRRAGTTPTKLDVLGFVTVKLELKKTGFQTTKAKLYSKVPEDRVNVRLPKS